MNVIVANPNSLAFEDQLNQLIKITKLMTKEIGYVMPIVLREQASRGNLLLLMSGNLVMGFCNYNIRKKDGVGVIYEVGTHPAIRGKGGGKQLVEAVLTKCEKIHLKCPIDNKSNGFYSRIGEKIGVEQGKKRPLNLWQITNKTVKEES